MSGNIPPPRKKYFDNIRSATIVLVLMYHVVYIFNSAGVVSNIPIQGIPALDSICYFLYPWFMCLLFVVAGISARYSLQTRSAGQFARERVRKLIVPYLGGAFLLGWLNGWVTAHYVDMFGGQAVPGFVKYLVYTLNIGPLWFLLELFVISILLLLIRKLDRRDRLWTLAGKASLPLMVLLFLLKQHAVLFSIIAVGLGVAEVWYFFGQNYASDACLQHPLTNLYLWMMILAILGCAQRWLDFSNSLTKYLQKRSFALYVFHYPLLVTAAYWLTTYTELPMAAVYLILLPFTFAAPILFYEIVSRIPVIRYLLLGK